MGKKWTEEEINLLKEYYPKMTAKEVQSKYLPHRTINTIRKIVSNLGLNLKWKEEELQILKDNYGKITVNEIIKLYMPNRGWDSIINKANEIGLTRQWSDEEDKILTELYGKVETKKIVEKLPNRTISAIYNEAFRLKLIGFSCIPPIIRKWKFNENYFSVPTLENCWVAGLLAADGCIADDNSITLGLNINDIVCVEFIKKSINFDGPVFRRKRLSDGKEYEKDCYDRTTLTIHSKKFVNDLNKHWNITPRKSLTLQPPKDYINGDLALAMICGYIDGDGCISMRYKGNSLDFRFIICGNKDFLIWVKSVLDLLSPISRKESCVKKQTNSNCYILSYNGKRGMEIHNRLKEVPLSFRLSRKWDFNEYWKYKEIRKSRKLTNDTE